MTRQEVIGQALTHTVRACPGGPSGNLTALIALAIIAVVIIACFIVINW